MVWEQGANSAVLRPIRGMSTSGNADPLHDLILIGQELAHTAWLIGARYLSAEIEVGSEPLLLICMESSSRALGRAPKAGLTDLSLRVRWSRALLEGVA